MFTVIDYDSTLGWKMKPNIVEKIDLVDVEGIPVRSNSTGFWDDEFPVEKSSDRYRIAFLGDSFTWGMGVRESERFTNLVGANNPKWETLNFGIPGYGTDQSLLVWENVASRYQPDLVVLTVYENDYADNVSLVRSGRRKPYYELTETNQLELKNVPVDATDFWDDGVFNQIAPPYVLLFPEPAQKRSRVVHWLVKNSNLARLLYTVLRPGNNQEGAKEQVSKSAQQPATDSKADAPDLNPRQQKQVSLLSAIVERLAKEVKAMGPRLVVMLAGESSSKYEAQKKMLDLKGITWLDATTEVIAGRISEGGQVYYPYSKHWTPDSNRVVANLLNEFIHNRVLCNKCQ